LIGVIAGTVSIVFGVTIGVIGVIAGTVSIVFGVTIGGDIMDSDDIVSVKEYIGAFGAFFLLSLLNRLPIIYLFY
jgi:hypothetical protein